MYSLVALERITFDINSSRSKVYGYKFPRPNATRSVMGREDLLSKAPSFITYKLDSAPNQ
jgi:hypothetical protein